MTTSRPDYRAAKAQIALEALGVPVETTFSTECPICLGGEHRHKKLSVTRSPTGALFCCFRASCGFRGFVSLGEGQTTEQFRKPEKPANPYNGEFLGIDADLAQAIFQKYKGMSPTCSSFYLDYWGLGDNRWADSVFECRGFRGELLGYVTRSGNKAIKTYREKAGTDIFSVYRPFNDDSRKSDVWFLVEDCISAMCVASHGYRAIALLGTNIPKQLDEGLGAEPGILMLDPDADEKSLKLGKEFAMRSIIGMPADPKDLPNLGDVLEEYA